MTNQQTLSDKAAARFAEGYNCAQRVLLTLAEHLDIDDPSLAKVATGFGSGMGCGVVCGALTGSIMAAGLKLGTDTPGREKRKACTQFSRNLYQQFQKQHGTTSCHELIGYDLSDPQQAAKAHEAGAFEKICAKLVRSAVQNFLTQEKETAQASI
jgi:C_GCAxxG_C_C family probable redox protein